MVTFHLQMSRVSNITRNLHPGCMWGKQRGPQSAGLDTWCWSRWLWQGFLTAKVTLQMQSGITAGEPEILYQFPRGKAFILESDTSGKVYIWVIILDSMCVHQQAEWQSFCKTFQGSFKICRSRWTWSAALWSQRKGPLSVGWGLIPRW